MYDIRDRSATIRWRMHHLLESDQSGYCCNLPFLFGPDISRITPSQLFVCSENRDRWEMVMLIIGG